MNFDELNAIIIEETGISICPICGTPFKKYHSRQKTCGDPNCKRLHHNEYLRARSQRLKNEDREAFNRSHAMAQRKSRYKKKMKEQADRNYAKIQSHWERIAEFDKSISDYGFDYGKRQAERTLAQVPKIDVEAFMKERREE